VLRDINAAYDELFKEYDVIIMPTIRVKPHQLLAEGSSIKGIRLSSRLLFMTASVMEALKPDSPLMYPLSAVVSVGQFLGHVNGLSVG
jgi:Asp-tRNA(Asn)/Glu-tRNA(Gln) amidotransferase A subunit family amidase